MQRKKGVYFSFDFGWYSIHLNFFCYKRVGGGRVFAQQAKSVKHHRNYFLTVTYHKQPLLDSELLPSHLSLLVGNLYISNTDKVSHFLMKYKFCNEQSTNINISKQSNIPVSLKHSFCFYLQHKMFFETSFCIHLLLFVILPFCSPLIM